MVGIALGVTVMITVLSVMNGFDEAIRSQIFSMAQQVTISATNGQTLPDTNKLTPFALKQTHVKTAAPFVQGLGILVNSDQTHPVLLNGVNPEQEKQVSEIPRKIVEGSFNLLPGHYNIVLGEELATQLGIEIGDKVNVITTHATLTPAAIMPRFKNFTVSGIFSVGRNPEFETTMAYIALQDAQVLFQLGQGVTGLRLKLDDLYTAPQVSLALAKQLPPDYQVMNWTNKYGSLMYAIGLEKNMMFFILLLLIAISAFNLVSSLMMVVTDKQSDIAILRTLGATPRTILSIFMVQGCIIGLVGTLLGLVTGTLLATYAGSIASFLEHSVFHTDILASNIYFFVTKLPSKIEVSDILKICTAAFGMSLLATIYPAIKAAKTAPAEALRYE